MLRRQGVDWPFVLTPAWGHAPPSRVPDGKERVLHVALRNSINLKCGLSRALRAMGMLREVEWMQLPLAVRRDRIMQAALEIRPTVVLMQIERGGTSITPQLVRDLREISAPGGVIVNWCEDQRYDPWQKEREWFVELGRECDASLITNTAHPAQYASMGVRCPGYWQNAVDCSLWTPDCEPMSGTECIVFLGSHYGPETMAEAYCRREIMLDEIHRAFPGLLACYGFGWKNSGFAHHAMLSNVHEWRAYQTARVALSLSASNHLPRYTSDRLFRMLASGAVCVVERFAECESLGLVDGHNCLIVEDEDWATPIRYALTHDCSAMREAARTLAIQQHDWPVRVSELQAIVDGVRENRGKWEAMRNGSQR